MPENSSPFPAAALLAALPDTVVVADDEGRIAYVSPSVRSLLGHDPAALAGRPLQVLMPERLRSGHNEGFSRFRATGEGKLVGATTQVPALHADGHEVPIDLTLSRLAAPAGGAAEDALVVAVLRDASTTILLERQFEVSRYLAATMRVTAALTEAPDADVAFERLLPRLCAELDWDAAQLWQPDGDGRLVHAGTWSGAGARVPALEADAARRTFRRGQGLPGQAWLHRAPVVFDDLASDPGVVRRDALCADGLSTGVAFPVLRGDALLAVCELFSTRSRPVPPELLDVLGSAGRQIGQFLGRLRAESEVRQLADTLQRSLLPSHLPVLPGLELAARYRAGGGDTAFVGGDTYDVMPLPDGRWLLLIADVCGTGAEAAAVTAITRHTARAAAAAAGGSPAAILAAVNTALLHAAGDGPLRFVTACCLVLEPGGDGHRGRLGVAGHPLPVLRAPDDEVRVVGTPGRPLGIDADVEFQECTVELLPGSSLLLCTDGVTEARDDAGRQFGDDALLRVVAGAPLDAEAMAGAVAAAVEQQLAGSRHQPDDLAVLALVVPR